MSTVALTMIVKDEAEEVNKIVEQAVDNVDQLILVISDKPTANKFKKAATGIDKVEVYWREWNGKFDDARNFALSKVKTDYWFWIDADDTFDFTQLRDLVSFAEQNNLDQVLLPYNYAQNEQGECIAYHWRERLMKTSHPFTWKGWVHETPITDSAFKAQRVNIEVTHATSEEHTMESVARNLAILREAVKETNDPRYKMYLGTTCNAMKQYKESIEVLDEFIDESGSDEDIYRALQVLSESSYHLGNKQQAINYALQAAGLIPEYPQAYWLLAQWEADMDNWEQALTWIKLSETLPDPNSLAVYDPSSRNRARLTAAQACFMLKKHNEALKWLRKVPESDPNRQQLEEGFINEADAETFIKLLPKIRKYFESDAHLYNALCHDIAFDKRLRPLRESVTTAKQWADNSITILCGEGYEEWGPHTLDKGMGGSEEAIVYLTRELAKLGWSITVYGSVNRAVDDPGDHPTVIYLPAEEFDRRDKFNVFIGWRAPDYALDIDAKVKIIDMHDVVPEELVKPWADVTYFLKSQYHRDLYPQLRDARTRIIGNGIKKDQFNG